MCVVVVGRQTSSWVVSMCVVVVEQRNLKSCPSSRQAWRVVKGGVSCRDEVAHHPVAEEQAADTLADEVPLALPGVI